MSEGPIILFDGVCHLCNRAVQFIIARDRGRKFRFASLQSPTGRQLLDQFRPDARNLNSMVLIADGVAYTRSDAALRVAGRLSGPWPALKIFLLVPHPIRNWSYDLIAKNRHRWFGTKSACLLPSPELRRRLLP